jgi:hypothetical protein
MTISHQNAPEFVDQNVEEKVTEQDRSARSESSNYGENTYQFQAIPSRRPEQETTNDKSGQQRSRSTISRMCQE